LLSEPDCIVPLEKVLYYKFAYDDVVSAPYENRKLKANTLVPFGLCKTEYKGVIYIYFVYLRRRRCSFRRADREPASRQTADDTPTAAGIQSQPADVMSAGSLCASVSVGTVSSGGMASVSGAVSGTADCRTAGTAGYSAGAEQEVKPGKYPKPSRMAANSL